MPGLDFDDHAPPVDPHMPLGDLFAEWAVVLAGAKQPRTVEGYVSDAYVFGRALLDVVGRELPAVCGDREALATYTEYPAKLRRRGNPVVPVAVFGRAHAVAGALMLVDLAPWNLERAATDVAVGRAAASRQRMLSAWSSLCDLAVRRRLLARNPMGGIERGKANRANPKPLDRQETSRLLTEVATPDPQARGPWPERDLALAAVLLSTGVRLEEVITRQVGDVRKRAVDPRLHVTGKGNKDRTVPLHDEALTLVDVYLADRARRLGTPRGTDPLFVRSDGSAFTPRALRRLVERWFVRAGIPRRQGAAVHLLRHTAATDALDGGATIREVQELLGHKSIQATQVYLHVAGGLRDLAASHPSRELLRGVAGRREAP